MIEFMKKTSFAAALLLGASVFAFSSAHAESAAELSVRMSQVEDQMRQLIGQVEQLSFEVRQLKEQIGKRKAEAQPDMAPPAAAPSKPKTKIAAAGTADQGIEQIQDNNDDNGSQPDSFVTEDDAGQQITIRKAPSPKILGTLPGSSESGGGGQVLGPHRRPIRT